VIDNLETISRVIALQPQKVSVIGWLKIIAKLKNNVKVCALSDEFGRILEIVAFEKMKAIENLPDYTLVICNIKMNDYKGRSGYVLEKYDPIID
jgi:2,3-bisphosphoglycerate-independent phosphoglycerate mutase